MKKFTSAKLISASLAVLLSATVALAPVLAEARAGNSTSSGSRGSRTFESNGAAPIQRSVTPQPAPRPSAPQPAPGLQRPATAAAGGGFFSQHPFLSGLAGGFIGAGIAGMIFGHSPALAAGGEASSGGGMLGLLLQLALIGGAIWLVVSFIRRRSANNPDAANAPAAAYYQPVAANAGYGSVTGGGVSGGASAAIQISDSDYVAFGNLLVGIQEAWSHSDLAAMKRFMTPEMLSYFSEELSANASRGFENKVEQITLLKGDLEEAWEEHGMQYASARLRWTAKDYNVRIGSAPTDGNYLVEGSRDQLVEASEVWTFVRSANGGHWLLSAIQQA